MLLTARSKTVRKDRWDVPWRLQESRSVPGVSILITLRVAVKTLFIGTLLEGGSVVRLLMVYACCDCRGLPRALRSG